LKFFNALGIAFVSSSMLMYGNILSYGKTKLAVINVEFVV